MQIDELKKIVSNIISDDKYKNDKRVIESLDNELNMLIDDDYDINLLDDIKNKVEYLDEKYDYVNELGYYYDTIYVEKKKRLHENEVANLRKQNRERRNNIA